MLQQVQNNVGYFNGCMIFAGKLDGSPMRNGVFAKYQAELDRVQSYLSFTAGKAHTVDLALTNISNQNLYELKKLLPELKTLSDTMKNMKVIAGRGGGSGGIEAIAEEF